MNLDELFEDTALYSGEDIKRLIKIYLSGVKKRIYEALLIGPLNEFEKRLEEIFK